MNKISAHQQVELDLLLQTNSVLIENKRAIYGNKIATCNKQIEKLMTILKVRKNQCWINTQNDSEQSWEEDDQKSIRQKIRQIEMKREQIIKKLNKVEVIQKDMRAIENSQQKSASVMSSSLNNNKVKDGHIYKSGNTPNYNQCTTHKGTNNNPSNLALKFDSKMDTPVVVEKVKNLSLSKSQQSIKQGGRHNRKLHKSDYLFVDMRQRQENSEWDDEIMQNKSISTLKQSNKRCNIKIEDILKKGTNLGLTMKEPNTTSMASHKKQIAQSHLLIYQQYQLICSQILQIQQSIHSQFILQNKHTNFNGSSGFWKHRDNFECHIEKGGQNGYVFKQIYDKILKIKQYISYVSDCNTKLEIQNAQLTQKQAKQETQDKMKEEEKRSMQQLVKIQEECEIYCSRISNKQKQYDRIMCEISEIESYKQKIQTSIQEYVCQYQNQFDQLYKQITIVYDTISIHQNFTKHKTMEKLKINKLSKNELNTDVREKLIEMFGLVQKQIEGRKLEMLEGQQSLIKIQHKLSLLDDKQKQMQKSHQQMQNKLAITQHCVKQTQKQMTKISKQKHKLESDLTQLREQKQKYGDLVAAKKSTYSQLDSKYNALKVKKQKMENKCKCLEQSVCEKEARSGGLDEDIQLKEKQVESINEQMIQKLKNKEQLLFDIEAIETKFIKQSAELKSIQSVIDKKNKEVQTIDKHIKKVQQAIQKYQRKIMGYEGQQKQLTNTILEKQQSLKMLKLDLEEMNGKVERVEKGLKQKQGQLQNVCAKLAQQQNMLMMTNAQIQKSEGQLKDATKQTQSLETVKFELQQAIAQILEKKQYVMDYLSNKHEQVQLLEQKVSSVQMELAHKHKQSIQISQQINELIAQNQTLFNTQSQIETLLNTAQARYAELTNYLQFNRDEELNLTERIQTLKKVEQKLLIQIAMRGYCQNQKDTAEFDGLLNEQTKQQIESILQSICDNEQLKQLYAKVKQENRKLKLDNDRLQKMFDIDHINDSDCFI